MLFGYGAVASQTERGTVRESGPPATAGLFLDVGTDVIDRLLDRRDLFGVVVGNLGFELLFERHDELDGIE
jgi:hypothetical protein